MTAQVTESLKYEGQNIALCEEPLADYFSLIGKDTPFEAPHTALWCGYVGEWEIIDDRIYLVGLKGWVNGGEQVNLAYVFPGFPSRVFAHWITGTLRATRGKQLKYVHAGYASVYEQDLFFEFEAGRMKSLQIRDNAGSVESE